MTQQENLEWEMTSFAQWANVPAIAIASGALFSACVVVVFGASFDLILIKACFLVSSFSAVLALLAKRIRFDSLRTLLVFFSLMVCIAYWRIDVADWLFVFLFSIVFISFSEGVVGVLFHDRDDVSLVGTVARVAMSVMANLAFFRILLCPTTFQAMTFPAFCFFISHMVVVMRLYCLASYEIGLKGKEKVEGLCF